MKKILLTILLLLLVPNAEAATYWVRPAGTLAACTPSSTAPATDAGYMSTINAGIACLSAGDTLYIRAGTYAESINKPPPGSSASAYTTVTGYSDEVVIVQPVNGNAFNLPAQDKTWKWVAYRNMVFDGTHAGAGPDHGSGPSICCREFSGPQPATKMSTGPNFITFADIEVRNFKSTGMEVDANDITIQRVKVHHNATDNFYGPPHGIYFRAARSLIEDSEFYNNGYYGIHMYDSSSGASQGNIVRRVKAYNNGFSTVDAGFGTGGGGILIGSGANNRVYNSIAYNNGFPNGGAGIQIDHGCTNCLAYNNTSYGNRSSGMQIINGSPTVQNNILANNTGGETDFTFATGTITQDYNLCFPASCPGANSVNQDPRFADPDPAIGDFHPCTGDKFPKPGCAGPAPSIDKGIDLSGAGFTTDIENKPRPRHVRWYLAYRFGDRWDIGAYEYGRPFWKELFLALIIASIIASLAGFIFRRKFSRS